MKEQPTDSETAELSDLLNRIQAVLEDRSKNYSPVTVINVLVNLSARYAVASKWPLRNYKKICEATYRAQKRAVDLMQQKKDEEAAVQQQN